MKNFRYYDIIIALFVATLIISNIVATKLINFGSIGDMPIIADGGVILFPLAYILGDVLTEVYGFRYVRRAIWIGFGAMLLALSCFAIVQHLPADANYQNQAAYEAVLGYVPRIALASLVAYLFGEFLNAYVLAKLKVKMAGKKLWFRLIGSTLVGGFVDTLIFCLIAFGGIISTGDMVAYILLGWLFKSAVEVILLPLTYRAIAILKSKEHTDHYDRKTDFTPFSTTI